MTTKTEIKLEPTLERNGRVIARCQARSKRTGEQCTQAARKDQRVCHVNGSGTKKREASGERKPMGRPPTHGLYSKRGYTDIQDLTETVHETEGALGNSDRDLAVLKATLWFLTNQSENFLGKATEFESAADLMSGVLES